MSDRLNGLREKRGQIVATMREILDKADAEKRSLTDEELAKHDELFNEQERLGNEIRAAERQQEADRAAAEEAAAAERRRHEAGEDPENRAGGAPNGDAAYRAFQNFLRTGTIAGDGAAEFRALQADADTEGGYLVAPEMFVNQLIKAVDDQVFIRRAATTFTVSQAQAMGAPSLDADPADADWTTELATGSEDSTMALGKRSLTPHPLAKRIKISNRLIRLVPSAEALVRERLAYKFGITHEKAFLTGTGAGQPLGVFTASADGISTSRDISTGNSTTAIAVDGLFEAKYALKGQYHARATWLFHRDGVKSIAKLKDANNLPIWQPSLQAGQPDRLLNMPLWMSEYAPNTFTTGLYVGILGDFAQYWIADAISMQLQRLTELYAETNQVGIIGRLESDGMPVLEEAFARVTLA